MHSQFLSYYIPRKQRRHRKPAIFNFYLDNVLWIWYTALYIREYTNTLCISNYNSHQMTVAYMVRVMVGGTVNVISFANYGGSMHLFRYNLRGFHNIAYASLWIGNTWDMESPSFWDSGGGVLGRRRHWFGGLHELVGITTGRWHWPRPNLQSFFQLLMECIIW